MSTYFHVPSQVPLLRPDGRLQPPWLQLFTNKANLLNLGVPAAMNNTKGVVVPQSVTIPLTKLTGGGTNGSLTFTSGILTAYVVPT